MAVLVAEDITSRFLNILCLFIGTIPLIAIQLNALKVDGRILLNFTRVIDRTPLRVDDEVETKIAATDRDYWNKRATPKTVEMADAILAILNEKAHPHQRLNYNKYYIGLNDGMRSRNFIHFRPKKQFIHMLAEVSTPESWVEKLEQAGLNVAQDGQHIRLTLIPKDITAHRDVITELVHQAYEDYQQ